MSHHVEKNLLLWLPHLCHIIWKKMASSIFIIMWEAAVQRCFVKKVFLEISQSSQENTYSRVSFLIPLQASLSTPLKTKESIWSKERPKALLKKRLWHRCFPVNFVKLLRTPFYIEHLWCLLLKMWVFYVRVFSGQISVGWKSIFFSLDFLNVVLIVWSWCVKLNGCVKRTFHWEIKWMCEKNL